MFYCSLEPAFLTVAEKVKMLLVTMTTQHVHAVLAEIKGTDMKLMQI